MLYVYTDQDIDLELRSPLDLSKFGKLVEDARKNANEKVTLGPYFRDFKLPIAKIEQFKYGQSNPTYLLTDASGLKFVLRRKPTLNSKLISSKSHNIEREFDFLSLLGHYKKKYASSLPVTKMYLLCEDESYTGTVFYLMEFIDGIIFHDPFMPGLEDSKKRQCWESALRVSSLIHSVEISKLKEFLSPSYFPKQSSSFFERQVKTLTKISRLQASHPKVSEIPYFDKISKWLLHNAPKDPNPPTLIHGDYKMDNLVFNLETGQVIAVLDWELTTLGHPIFDLSNLLQPCTLPPGLNISVNNSSGTEPFEDCVKSSLEKYHEFLPSWGDPKEYWKCGVVFGLYRVAVITQGVYMRAQKGEASSAQANKFGALFTDFGKLLMKEIERDSKL